MIILDTIGWIGNIGFIVGAIFLARKKPVMGLTLNVFGNLAYTSYGIILKSSSITVLSIILLTLNIVGIINWKRK